MRLGPRSLCVWALMVGPAAWAQVPAGPVFQLNANTSGRQRAPQAALQSNGEFVVVWDHFDQYLVTPADVFGRRFAPGGGGMGVEFRVNVFTTSAQDVLGGRALSLDARGNAIVAWSDFRSGVDVFARRLPAGGTPTGEEFLVNQATAGSQGLGGVARAPDGRFVVVWNEFPSYDVVARRFDASGLPAGDEIRVNTNTTDRHIDPVVGMDRTGGFTVVWDDRDASGGGEIFAQRFGPAGERVGAEFIVNSHTTGQQTSPDIAMNGDGAAIVTWEGIGPGGFGFEAWGRRFSAGGVPLGIEFRLSAAGGGGSPSVAIDDTGNFAAAWKSFAAGADQLWVRRFARDGAPRSGDVNVAQASLTAVAIPKIATDGAGNFLMVWDDVGPGDLEAFGRRFGGLLPAGLAFVDGANRVLEVTDSFGLATSWRNVTGVVQTFGGLSSDVQAPPGLLLTLSAASAYGPVADGAVGVCTVCMTGGLSGTRPAGHVDAAFIETVVPDVQGQAKRWALHVGGSFSDVPPANPFYRFVETLLHRGVTGGCGANVYCPAGSTAREQMAVFVLAAKEGQGWVPPPCTTPVFADVPASSPFCRWIEELARRGVTDGCAPGLYCPGDAVTREQMAVFVLRTLDPALNPPACTTPVFADVPASSPFCRWIEELARRGVVSGCGGGNYCPGAPVTREQMSVFLTGTFGLTLYGP